MVTLLSFARAIDVGRELGSGFVRVERGPHYAQAALGPGDGRVYCEVVSNTFLESEARLLPAGEAVLASTGWRPPTSACGREDCAGEHPNFRRYFPAATRSWTVASALTWALRRAYFARFESLRFHRSPEIDGVIARRRAQVERILSGPTTKACGPSTKG